MYDIHFMLYLSVFLLEPNNLIIIIIFIEVNKRPQEDRWATRETKNSRYYYYNATPPQQKMLCNEFEFSHHHIIIMRLRCYYTIL